MSDYEKLFDEMVEHQKRKLFEIAEALHPGLTEDDLLQPNDFPILENHPHFRYEEGLLAGLQAARTAFCSLKNQEKVVVL